MDNPGEILRLCRLCLVKDQVNIPIFEEQGDIRQIFLKISSCLPVTVSRDDQLPKKICDGCSNKLDLLYEFWNTSANAEKTLLSWLGQAGVKDADETISAVAQQIAKPAETQVKQENLEDGHAIISQQDNFGLQSFDEDTKDEAEPPPRKRARRTAAVKAQISIAPESDDDDDDMDNTEAMTKVEGESEESDGEDRDPSYGEVPGTSADDQAGPSGVGKDGVEAPIYRFMKIDGKMVKLVKVSGMQCKLCNKIVHCGDMQNHLLSHKKKRVRKEKQRVSCPHCGKWFASAGSLYIHKQDIHLNKGKRYSCEICGRDFSSMRSCNFHKKSVHEQGKNHVFCCEICGKRYMFQSNLKQHLKAAHSELPTEPSKKCTVNGCPRVFRSTSSLKYHLHSHQDTKPSLTCSFCPKVLSHPKNLKEHERRHTSASRYSCHICNKAVTSLSSLKVHIRTHTGEKPFICEACGKEFVSMKLLKIHRVVHTKEKKHICRICNSSFTQRSPLKAHFQKKHPLEKL